MLTNFFLIAIWDNRSAFHTPTYDYDDLGDRGGNRAVSIAEKPFFGKNFPSRANNHNRRQDKLFADRSFFVQIPTASLELTAWQASSKVIGGETRLTRRSWSSYDLVNELRD